MSEMVERVARAMSEAFDREGRVFEDGQAGMLARAAIMAMREPTEGMIWEGRSSVPLSDKKSKEDCPKDDGPDWAECLDWLSVEEMQRSWESMIDEALK